MKSRLMRLPLIVALCAMSSPAFADPDTLPQERFSFIKVAFERDISDPATDPDRISPAVLATVRAAYSTHRPPNRVDEYPNNVWRLVQAAYQTHNQGFDSFVLANDF